jgi:hypothetical protein
MIPRGLELGDDQAVAPGSQGLHLGEDHRGAVLFPELIQAVSQHEEVALTLGTVPQIEGAGEDVLGQGEVAHLERSLAHARMDARIPAWIGRILPQCLPGTGRAALG